MPASILQGIAEAILQPIFEAGCYYVGRVLVPIVSLGRLKCDRLTADTPRRKLRWGGLFHRRGQQVYLTAEATAGAGLLFIALVVAGGFLIYYFRD
jgi:hypothetical protein